jgi:hypothetical protein
LEFSDEQLSRIVFRGSRKRNQALILEAGLCCKERLHEERYESVQMGRGIALLTTRRQCAEDEIVQVYQDCREIGEQQELNSMERYFSGMWNKSTLRDEDM